MIDSADQLLAARFAALANSLDDSDWLDVLSRAGEKRSRLWLALPLAAALAALLIGSAFAFHAGIIDFLRAEPAPQRIVIEFGRLHALGSIRPGPNVIPGEARKITTTLIEGKSRPLYVAPTSDGGFCWRWHRVGGCRPRATGSQRSLGGGGLESEHGGPAQIHGELLDPGTQRLELQYEDGARAVVPFVWVTAPINAGFYYYEVPSTHLLVGHRAAVLRALDENSEELARQRYLYSDPQWEQAADGLPRIADRTQKRTLFDFRDQRGTRWSLVIAPAPGDRLCYAYNLGGGCLSPQFPATIGGMSAGGGNVVSLCCAVAEDVVTVVLHYQDGTLTELQPSGGFLLYVLPPEQYLLGHRLEQIVWLSGEGKEVARRTLRPDQRGVYPCQEEDEIELGYGVTTCP